MNETNAEVIAAKMLRSVLHHCEPCGLCSGNTADCNLFGRAVAVQISANLLSVLADIFRGFSHSLQWNGGVIT
jgi:hypothetical protein